MATWNHRLVEHRYGEEVWVEVHEIHYDEKGVPEGFTSRSVSPRSRWEAKKMLEAFDKSIAFWVNEETLVEGGGDPAFPDWKEWGRYDTEVWYKEDQQVDKGPISDEEDLGDVT